MNNTQNDVKSNINKYFIPDIRNIIWEYYFGNFDQAMIWACHNGNDKLTQFCLDMGATSYCFSLEYAATSDSLECAKIIIDAQKKRIDMLVSHLNVLL